MTSPLYSHPAITVSIELYDKPRDLEPHEEAFRSEVARIRNECVATTGQAARQWGYDSIAHVAVVALAERKCAADLTAALERYETEIEAQDGCLEVEAEQQREVA